MADTTKKIELDRDKEFYLSGLYRDVSASLGHSQKPIEDIFDEALVTVDANVLLFPYETSSTFLPDYEQAFNLVKSKNNLFVSGHAVREFLKNRQKLIYAMISKIDGMITKAKSHPFSNSFAMLDGIEQYENAKNLASQQVKAANSLKDALESVRDLVKSKQFGNDPVSISVRNVFSDCIEDIEFDENRKSDILADGKRRQELSIPPGYKDSAKDASLGDLIIWRTILDNCKDKRRDLIFVTEETKSDWWFKSDGPQTPRPELVEEYRSISQGGSLYLCDFKTFLKLANARNEAVSAVSDAKGRASALDELANLVRQYEMSIDNHDKAIESLRSLGMAFKGAHARYHHFGIDEAADQRVLDEVKSAHRQGDEALAEVEKLENEKADFMQKRSDAWIAFQLLLDQERSSAA